MNVSEVIIMLRTIIQAMGKVFPQANFFKDLEVLEEVKPAMYMIFQEYIEKTIFRESDNKNQSTYNEKINVGFIGFSKRKQLQEDQVTHGAGSLIPLNSTSKSEQSTSASPSSAQGMTSPVLPKETLDEKKRRIFKWTSVEEVKLPMDFVKT